MIIRWHVWHGGKWYHCNKVAQHITPTVSTFQGFNIMEVYGTLCNTKMIMVFMVGYPLFYRRHCSQYTWITRVLRNQCIWQCNVGLPDLYAHIQPWHMRVYVYTKAIHFAVSTRTALQCHCTAMSLHCNTARSGTWSNFDLTTCMEYGGLL